MRLRTVLGAALCLISSAAMANGLEFQLGGKTADLRFFTNSGLLGYGGAELGFGGFVNSDSDYMGSVGLMVQGIPAGQSPLTFGLGVKAYAAHVHDPSDNVEAITLGGLAKYTIPGHIPMAAVAAVHYAPQITTFSDGKSFTDLGLNYFIEVTPGASAYIGYRYLHTELKDHGGYNFDDNIHVGVKLDF